MLLKATCLVVAILQIVSCANDKDGEFKIDSKQLAIINGTSYYFMNLLATKLYDAQMVCKDGGMSLIALENQFESDAVWTYIQQEQLNAVYWTSGVRVETNWLWSSTGVYLDYDNWGPLEPNYQGFPTQACIYFFDGFIHDTSCGDHLPFICEKLPCINA